MSSTWLDTFGAGTLQHGLVATISFLAMAMTALYGRRRLGAGTEVQFRTLVAGSVLGWQTLAVLWWLLPSNFDITDSLPLHVCDVVVWVAPFALLTQHPFLRALLYFWGIGLSTQAFFTPVVSEGLAHPQFWLFWIGHVQIVGSAIYDVVVLGYRPNARGYLAVTVFGVFWSLVLLSLNLAVGANYGYLGASLPEHPTLLDHLGPWPWRAGAVWLVAQTAMLVAWFAWPVVRCLRPGTTGPADA